jgi:hypothetical protein
MTFCHSIQLLHNTFTITMSTNLNYKQVANVERRTWDVAAYEQRAKERAKNESAAGAGDKKKKRKHDKSSAPDSSSTDAQDPYKEGGEEQKEEFQRAAKGAAGPAKSERAFLKARRNRVDVDSKIGSVEIINPEAVATTKAQVGEPGSIKVRFKSRSVLPLGNLDCCLIENCANILFFSYFHDFF